MEHHSYGTSLVGFFLLLILGAANSYAAPNSLTYQGRIIKSDGTPLEFNNVSFQFEITSPNGQCILYREQIDHIDMTNSGGMFDIPIGGGAQTHPNNGTFTLLDSFNNSTPFACDGGSIYNATSSDQRKLRVRFHDGTGWKTISPDNVIRSVPYSAYAYSAEKLGSFQASDFVQKNAITSCPANNFLTFNGTNFSCAPVSGASGGTVSDVTSSNAYLSVATGTSTPVLTLHVGSGVNTVAAGNDPRFSDSRVPNGTAGGDLSGTYPNPSVSKIQGVSISGATPTTGQFMKYDGAQWTSAVIGINDVANLSTTLSTHLTVSAFNTAVTSANCAAYETTYWNSVAGKFLCQAINVSVAGDISGTIGAVSVDKIKGINIDTTPPTNGQVLKFDGTKWAPAAVSGTDIPALDWSKITTGKPTSLAGYGITDALILNAGGTPSIQTGLDSAKPVSPAAGAIYFATDAKIIYQYNSGSWVSIASINASATPSGSAGGDLSGTYPNPTIGKLNGVNLSLSAPSTGHVLKYNGANWVNGSLSSTDLPTVPVDKGGTGQTSFANGEILIGNTTGNTLNKATLTAGTGISITNGTGSITIASTGASPTGSASGDLSGSYPGPTVAKLQGYDVASSAPSANAFLKWDNATSKWTPSFVKLSELTNLTGGSAFNAAGCTAAQTLNWSAITDKFECQNISIANTQVTGLGTASTKAAGTAANEVLLLDGSGQIPASALPSSLGQWQLSGTKLYYDDGPIIAGGIGTTYTGTNHPFIVKGDAGQMAQLIIDRGSNLTAMYTNGLAFNMGKCTSGTCAGYTDFLNVEYTGNRMDLGTGGSNNRVSILQSGYLGVGTTSPSFKVDVQSSDAFQQRLFHASDADYNGAALMMTRTRGTLSANTAVNSGNTIGGIYFRAHDGTSTGTTNSAIEVSATENHTTSARGTKMIFETTTTGSSTRSERMRIDSNGFVGIGTTGPLSALHVSRQANNEYAARISNGGGDGQGLLIHASDGGAIDTQSLLAVQNFDLSKDIFHVKGNGNVGIGTSSPIHPLHVTGPAAEAQVRISNGSYAGHVTVPTSLNGLILSGGTRYTGATWVAESTSSAAINVSSSGVSFFANTGHTIGNTNTNTVRMSVNPNGQVTIGSPASQAWMAGLLTIGDYTDDSAIITLRRSATSANLDIYAPYAGTDGGGYFGYGFQSSTGMFRFWDSVLGQRMNFTNTNGNMWIAGTYSNGSDRRFKQDIQAIPEALKKALQIQGVTYHWRPEINPDPAQQIGVIAQDVEKIFPQAVKTDAEGYKSVTYGNLVAPLFAAIQEFYELWSEDSQKTQREMASLKQEVEVLKKQNETFKKYLCDKDPESAICK